MICGRSLSRSVAWQSECGDQRVISGYSTASLKMKSSCQSGGMPLFAQEHGHLRPVPGAVQDDVGEKLASAASDGLSAASGNLVLLCQSHIICRFGKRTQLRLGFRRDREDSAESVAVEFLPLIFPILAA